MNAIHISSISTKHKTGLLFKYPLFLFGLRPRLLFRYPLFLHGKNQDEYSDILNFYLTKIGTAVQIFSVPSRPRTKTTVQISFVSTLQKERLLFRYSLFLLDTNQECRTNILCFYLEEIRTAI